MNASRTRIKICGLTRAQDVQDAAKAGADAIGFVFYPPSQRNLSTAQAAVLSVQVPAFVSTVALFVNPDPALVGAPKPMVVRQAISDGRSDFFAASSAAAIAAES